MLGNKQFIWQTILISSIISVTTHLILITHLLLFKLTNVNISVSNVIKKIPIVFNNYLKFKLNI